MFKRLSRIVMISVLASLLLVSCNQASQPSPTSQLETPGIKVAIPVSKANWQQEWEAVIAEGKKEGAVAIAGTWLPETRIALTQAFKDKYGIAVEFSPGARGAEVVAKVQAEERAGLYLGDFFGLGTTTAVDLLKPAGILGPLEPLVILPELKDPKYWRGGQLPFVDKDKQIMGLLAFKQPFIIYNTDLIKKGELTTYKDVLKPGYRGKITLNDPTTAGSGAALMQHLAFDLWNMEEAREFLRQLIKQQEVVIQRDNRLHVESVARGKFAIGLGGQQANIAGFLDAGAPLDVVFVKEGTKVSSGTGCILVRTKLAHPNAARVFLNWLLTKEGLTEFARTSGGLSMRSDVLVDGINPIYLFQPGEKLFIHTEETSLSMVKMMEISKKVIEEAGK